MNVECTWRIPNHNNDCSGNCKSAAKPNEKTVTWLRQRCARVSRTMIEMKEQEIMNKFLEAEDLDAERIREDAIFDKTEPPAWKFIEIAIERTSTAGGMIRITF